MVFYRKGRKGFAKNTIFANFAVNFANLAVYYPKESINHKDTQMF
jgi:hypothetical protein